MWQKLLLTYILTPLALVALADNAVPAVGAALIPCEGKLEKSVKDRTIECFTDERARANFKSKEILKLGAIKKTPRTKFDFEIMSQNSIDGGIEVFIKAWQKDGTPIGFGTDGTVEIERFRIINPPIMVPDPNGDYIREWVDETGNRFEFRFREDIREALLQSIEHGLSVMPLHGGENIVFGKVGKTTSTFYPSAGAASPIDGYVSYDPAATTWDSIHDFTGTASSANTTGSVLVAMVERANLSTGYKQIVRSHILFDTSAIPDGDPISSATLSLFGTAAGYQDNLPNASVNIYQSTLPSASNITTDDYDAFEGATSAATALSTAKDMTTISQSAYEDFALNASGLANISVTTVSKFAMREGTYDGPDSAPGVGGAEYSRWQPSSADVAGTTQDPKLVVVHGATVDTISDIIFFE